MSAYYNEHDPYAAQWLRNLIDAGLIAPGDVDERSIEDVRPDDVRGYKQCHWFAGIGVWSYALRLAGWPDDRPCWTGSCPCQPFSIAAVAWERKGFDDSRHLYPTWAQLIAAAAPEWVFGEQVASGPGLEWFDAVASDLEDKGYAVGSAVLPAAGIGSSHVRYRNFFCAHAVRAGRSGHQPLERIPESAGAPFAFAGDETARIRRALAGDYSGLLPGDDVAIAVERARTKGYGNAIVAKVAAEFVRAAGGCIEYA